MYTYNTFRDNDILIWLLLVTKSLGWWDSTNGMTWGVLYDLMTSWVCPLRSVSMFIHVPRNKCEKWKTNDSSLRASGSAWEKPTYMASPTFVYCKRIEHKLLNLLHFTNQTYSLVHVQNSKATGWTCRVSLLFGWRLSSDKMLQSHSRMHAEVNRCRGTSHPMRSLVLKNAMQLSLIELGYLYKYIAAPVKPSWKNMPIMAILGYKYAKWTKS